MTVILRVNIPIASFPTSRSREYRETYPVPPPSTVYGMLLSLVGETDRYKHCGIKIAIALLSEPAKSVTLRTMRRFKKKKLDHKENTRPDFQEILTGIELMIWVDKGEDSAKPSLGDRITEAFANGCGSFKVKFYNETISRSKKKFKEAFVVYLNYKNPPKSSP